jgi:hypothetical protein
MKRQPKHTVPWRMRDIERHITLAKVSEDTAYTGINAIHKANDVKEQYMISWESFMPSGSFLVLMANTKHTIINKKDQARLTK